MSYIRYYIMMYFMGKLSHQLALYIYPTTKRYVLKLPARGLQASEIWILNSTDKFDTCCRIVTTRFQAPKARFLLRVFWRKDGEAAKRRKACIKNQLFNVFEERAIDKQNRNSISKL